jgi:hypothetical protein
VAESGGCLRSSIPVDRAYYEEVAGILHGLLIRLDDRLPGKDVTLIAEFIDTNELGLAREQIGDVLSEDEKPLAADERADMLALVDRMQMGDSVPRALSLCPARQ